MTISFPIILCDEYIALMTVCSSLNDCEELEEEMTIQTTGKVKYRYVWIIDLWIDRCQQYTDDKLLHRKMPEILSNRWYL